jgi:GDP-L-fucose synthase
VAIYRRKCDRVNFWKDKNVLVTGGAGFIGSHVVELLLEKEAKVRVADNPKNGSLDNLKSVKDNIEFKEVDLYNPDSCKEICKGIDVVLHLAARVGGVEFNSTHAGTMFRDNVLVNTNVMEAARINNVERFLAVSSACVYSRHCKIPTPETEGFAGEPEPTNYGYGWSKRIIEVQARAYHEEFGMKISIARPYNCYGPRDHFSLERSHVIPALINRVYSGEDPVVVWGDGEQTRAFLYVTDLANGLVSLTEKYPVPDPINIGTDEEIKMKDLINLILEVSNKKVKVVFDTSKPSGQPRRNCDNTKAKEKISFLPKVKLQEGLKKTIEWDKSWARL